MPIAEGQIDQVQDRIYSRPFDVRFVLQSYHSL